ncbi:MAG: FAD-binding protein [Alphaproteobacteria bacterium]|jgi:FAD/FMN-containing dehydrogenase|nr:FAD-binding protein [Alphaproteobacteria bacterium]
MAILDTPRPDPLPAPFLDALKDLLGEKGWTREPEALTAAATPWRGAFAPGHTPLVARPASTAEAAALVKLCARHGVAITPQGGNTGLVDGGTPHGEITVSMTRMQAVRDLDRFNNSLIIEAGTPLVTAQEAAREADRLFPLSLGSEGSATIGGLISTNAGGVAVLRYGMMRDLLLGLEVVLPSGDVWDGLSGLRKNNTGYDLKHLFAGAEGTLGLITAATLKLFPAVQRASAWITCESAGDVVALLARIRETAGDTVTSFEMIPENAVRMVREDMANLRDPLPSSSPWRVLCEISMGNENHARETLENALGDALEDGLASDAVIAENLGQAGDFWAIRESIPLSKKAFGMSVNHDVSVPVSKIPDFLEAAARDVAAIAPQAEIVAFGHVGDGNLHYSACDPADPEQSALKPKAGDITAAVHARAMSFGGSISAEHGVGRLKRDELAGIRPPAATEAMGAIKQALDPLGIMNPGRVVNV